jgi:hypothetical protein
LDGRPPIIQSITELAGMGGKDASIELWQVKGELVTTCLEALTTLVLSLATRNVVKRTVKNKRINRTNKKSKPQFQGPLGAIYLSSTVIEAPDAEDMEADPDHPAREGVSPRPHMRRGHLHTVVHGVGRRERRVPKHGSWLDLAESELGVLSSQCLDRRIPDKQTLIDEIAAWEHDRNANHTKANWQFTTPNARIKLKHLYPSI